MTATRATPMPPHWLSISPVTRSTLYGRGWCAGVNWTIPSIRTNSEAFCHLVLGTALSSFLEEYTYSVAEHSLKPPKLY
ncbi:hypothetical protein NMY22_g16894 [Coprinellus aureogranulatus]|nr:hypothetical protein NMY22_g16894 [Coprinellus aureogranulatus]